MYHSALQRHLSFPRFLCLLLAVLIAISTMCVGGGFAGKAFAAQNAYLSIGGVIPYAGYSTNWMTADGAMAYCGNPSSSTPSSGAYTRSSIVAMSGRSEEVKADLWFGYGSPGFDASMWPSTYYDGGAMTAERYAALTHIILSDTFSSDCQAALYGCNQAFRDWAHLYIIGFDTAGNEINSQAVGRQMCARGYEIPSNFNPYMIQTGAETQVVLSFEYIPYGSIALTKRSANTSLSAGNACYSLEGAVYGVYRDSGCTALVKTMQTDSDGYARVDEIEPGHYFVREITVPSGFALDESVYPVDVSSDRVAPVNGGTVFDVPQGNPIEMLLEKVNADTEKGYPEGSASLAGSEFCVKYYDGYYADAKDAAASGNPSATWVFATDDAGQARYVDEYKVSGDELYRLSDGVTPALPLGTITVRETKAPQGYNLDDGHHADPPVFCIQIASSGQTGESIHVYNSLSVPDSVQRGDYRLFKEVPLTNDEEAQELSRIAIEGIEFQIINESSHAVLSPQTGLEVASGDVVCTIISDENGFASTMTLRPSAWTGALSYGEYTVHEVIPDAVASRVRDEHGITLIGVDDWNITISKEQQYDPIQIVSNHIPQTPIVIQKKDATTGRVIPLACSFKIFDASGMPVSYTDRYTNETIDTWTTLESGSCTLPMKLDGGVYTLHEVAAPEGYQLGTTDVEFVIDEYHTWQDPVVIVYEDMPIMKALEISKADTDTGRPVIGAMYRVQAAADIVTGDGTVRALAGQVIADVTIGDDGTATVDNLFLGTYLVFEIKAPDGYTLDTKEHTVVLSEETLIAPQMTNVLFVEDQPTKLVVKKVDTATGEKLLEGAVVRVWQDESEGADSYDETFVTDENGEIEVPYLLHGAYHIEEIEAPQNYFIPEGNKVIDFFVDDQGFIRRDAGTQLFETLEIVLENDSTNLDVSKIDATTGSELAGATLELADSNGTKVASWVSTNEPHRISGLLPGPYVLTETIAPEGYLFTESVAFHLEATSRVQKVVMSDDYTKVEVEKTDAVTGQYLEGASLVVVNAEGIEVAEWITKGGVHRICGLAPGNYVLRETKAPDGYEIAEDVAFSVKANGDACKVSMQDVPKPAGFVPKTGDIIPLHVMILVATSLCLACATFALAVRMGKKR